MERRTTKEKEKERVPNSRFESDAAGGVVQLRKHVEFEMTNVEFKKCRMSNFESLFAAQLQNTESRLLSQGERYGEKVEVCISIFVTK